MPMEGKIVTLQDVNGNIFPQTTAKAVYMSNGKSVEEAIKAGGTGTGGCSITFEETSESIVMNNPDMIQKVNNIEENISSIITYINSSNIDKLYDLSNQFKLLEDVEISSMQFNNKIILDGNGHTIYLKSGNQFVFKFLNDVIIKNCIFDGRNLEAIKSLIDLSDGCFRAEFYNCEFKNLASIDAFEQYFITGSINGKYLVFENCYFHDITNVGGESEGGKGFAGHIYISDTTIDKDVYININNCKFGNCSTIKNTVSYCDADAVRLLLNGTQSANVTLQCENSYFTNCQKRAFKISNTKCNLIIKNIVADFDNPDLYDINNKAWCFLGYRYEEGNIYLENIRVNAEKLVNFAEYPSTKTINVIMKDIYINGNLNNINAITVTKDEEKVDFKCNITNLDLKSTFEGSLAIEQKLQRPIIKNSKITANSLILINRIATYDQTNITQNIEFDNCIITSPLILLRSNVTFKNCEFIGTHFKNDAIDWLNPIIEFINCKFVWNDTDSTGLKFRFENLNVVGFDNCEFIGTTFNSNGVPLFDSNRLNSGRVIINNCIFNLIRKTASGTDFYPIAIINNSMAYDLRITNCFFNDKSRFSVVGGQSADSINKSIIITGNVFSNPVSNYNFTVNISSGTNIPVDFFMCNNTLFTSDLDSIDSNIVFNKKLIKNNAY